jgi:predicted enzyme related to lactoylglutathione lyase
MKLLGLRTLIYPSNDLATDKKWWADVLGIEPYFDQPFYVGFNVGGYELGLDPNGDMADGPRTYFGVDDVHAAVDHFVEAGCTVYEQAMETGDDIVVATVKKPNGQLLGLIYNPHFKEV